MIRLKKLQDVLDHKDTIPTLACIRGIQFLGSQGHNPEIDGWIVVLNSSTDNLTQIKEIGVNEYADILDCCEYIESFVDVDRLMFEVVFQLDDSRTIALIISDEPWLDPDLRKILISASPPPMPMPQIKEVMP